MLVADSTRYGDCVFMHVTYNQSDYKTLNNILVNDLEGVLVMYTDSSQATAQTMLDVQNWVKRGRYVRLELYRCAMRHCINGKFFLRQPLGKLQLLAEPIAEVMGLWLMGLEVSSDKFVRPFVNLIEVGAKPENIAELLDQFEGFFLESLENGFNAPSGLTKQLVLSRFQSYMQEARMRLSGLYNKPVPTSPVSQFQFSSSNLSFKFFGS